MPTKKPKRRSPCSNYSKSDLEEADRLFRPINPDFHWLSAFRTSKPHYWHDEHGGNQLDFDGWSLREIFLYMMKDSLELARLPTEYFGSIHYVGRWKPLDNKKWYCFIGLLIHMDAHPKVSAEEHFKEPVHPRVKLFGIGFDEYKHIIRSIRLYDCEVKRQSGESIAGSTKYDPLFKIRDFLNTTMLGFQAARLPPGPYISLDEEVAYCKVCGYGGQFMV